MSRLRYAAAIFDLDGTLLDTLEDLAESMNAVLRSQGYPAHPVDAYRTFVGDGVANLVARALPPGERDPQLLERCVQAMQEQYGNRWARATAPYAGVPELLRTLAGLDIAMAVLSNKPHDLTRAVVAHFFRETPFRLVLGAREGVPRKPDPTAVREILRSFAIPETRTLYVGDSSTDMDTARASGLTSVGVLWGFRSKEELLRHGACCLVSKPAELVRFFSS